MKLSGLPGTFVVGRVKTIGALVDLERSVTGTVIYSNVPWTSLIHLEFLVDEDE